MGRSGGRLAAAIDEWVQAQRDQGIAGGVIRERLLEMTEFMKAIGNLYLVTINDRHVTKYLAINKATWSKTKRKKVTLVLAEFFYWAYRSGYIQDTIKPLIRVDLHRKMPAPRKRRSTFADLTRYNEYDPWTW